MTFKMISKSRNNLKDSNKFKEIFKKVLKEIIKKKELMHWITWLKYLKEKENPAL